MIYFRKLQIRNREKVTPSTKKVNPTDIALNKLEELKINLKNEPQIIKKGYFVLTEILGEFITNKTNINLKQAKYYLDLLLMLQKKTKSNLSEYEEQMLINNLSELKMSFIEVKQSVEYVDKNGKVYKACLTRNPEGCPDPYLFYGYINTPMSEEVVQLKKGGTYWCKTSVILSLLEENHNWNEHNHRYHFWCDKNGWVKSKSP